jgi:hypothetical protein
MAKKTSKWKIKKIHLLRCQEHGGECPGPAPTQPRSTPVQPCSDGAVVNIFGYLLTSDILFVNTRNI